ncbi:MAG: helicase-related protein [Bacillota bacterium]
MKSLVMPFEAAPDAIRRVSSPLPLYGARWVQRAVERLGFGAIGRGLRLRRFARAVGAGLERMGLPGDGVVWLDPEAYRELANAPPGEDERGGAIGSLLTGRCLLGSELIRIARSHGTGPQEALGSAEALVRAGAALRFAAVEVDELGAVCRRCGSRDGIYPEQCAHCGSPFCPRCSRCAAMGTAKGCEPLYAMEAPLLDPEAPQNEGCPGEGGRLDPRLVASLSEAQRRAFEALQAGVCVRFEAGGNPRAPGGCLVWAVTGAGKTEVAFGAADQVLQRGGRVLFATPRREIAAEVAARAERAFRGWPVRLLMGRSGAGSRAQAAGSGWSRPLGQELIVATTHQALRFFRAFALVILDEFDAFPYAGSDMLGMAVERAAHPGGFGVIMSATPGQAQVDRVRRRGWTVIYIPARYHGRPLPVPQIWVHGAMRRWEEAPDDPGRVPEFIRNWLHGRRPGTRVLVFCPTVERVEKVARALRASACHSRHPGRDRIVAEFAASRERVLVTTTLLERGVTFAGVDVLVLFADQDGVFDEAALVQMAGRCGRSPDRPEGRVLFAAATRSRAMRRAVESIAAMNERARAAGLLRLV